MLTEMGLDLDQRTLCLAASLSLSLSFSLCLPWSHVFFSPSVFLSLLLPCDAPNTMHFQGH